MSSFESDLLIMNTHDGYVQGLKRTSPTGFGLWMRDESGSAAEESPLTPRFDCDFPEPNLIWLLPGQEVPSGICNTPGTISRHSISSLNDVSAGVAASSCVCAFVTDGTSNLDLLYILSLLLKQSAASSHPGCVNSSSFICLCRNHSMRCRTILNNVPNTQPGSPYSLSWHCSLSWSSPSSPSSPESELVRLLRLSWIVTVGSWHLFWDSPDVNPALSSFLISSGSCWIAGSATLTDFLAPAVPLTTWSSIHFSLWSLLMKWVSSHFLATSLFLNHKLCNAPRARTRSSFKPLLCSFASWCCCVDRFIEWQYLTAGSCKKLYFRVLSNVVCVDFVAGRDVEYCRIWTIWRHTVSFMSRLVSLINLNKAKSSFWLLMKWEYLGQAYNMTSLVASVSFPIPGIICDIHQMTSFPLKNVLFITDNDAILAVVDHNLLLYIAINIGLKHCKSQDSRRPLQLAPILSKIHLKFKEQVCCYSFYSDLKMTTYSSGHPASFHYHLPPLFHTTKSWQYKYLSQGIMVLNRAIWWALHPKCHWLAHSKNAATSKSTTILPMPPPKMWPRMHS